MCGNVVNSSSYMLTKQAGYVVGFSRFNFFGQMKMLLEIFQIDGFIY